MGLFSSSKSTSSSKVEDNRIAADSSFVAQIRQVEGDVILTDQGALALGEKGLDLANDIAAGALAVANERGQGAAEGVGKDIVKAAVPIAIVIAIAWAIRK